MTDLFDPIGSAFGGLVDSSAVQLTVRLLFLYVVVVWVATAWWAFHDVSRRTTSLPAPFVVAGLFVLATPVFFLPLAAVYRVLRPAETLAEASERDLTETALEATAVKETCPSCGSAVEAGWRLCPFCRYELLVACPRCANLVARDWPICPWCVHELPWAGREPVAVFAADERPAGVPSSWPDWSPPWAAGAAREVPDRRAPVAAAVGGRGRPDGAADEAADDPIDGANGRTRPPATRL